MGLVPVTSPIVCADLNASKKDYCHSYFEDNVRKAIAKATWNGINTLLSRKKNFSQATKFIIDEAVYSYGSH